MSEKNGKQNFIQRTKRYFYPLVSCPLISFKTFIVYSLWAVSPIIHIVFIQQLVGHIESGNKEQFLLIILWYAGYNIVYEILDFSMKKWGWVENINAYRKIIDTQYISKFITSDNNEVEKQGTGKLVSIVTNGSDVWALSLDEFVLQMTKIFYILVFTIYMIFTVSFLYGGVFIILYIILFFVGAYFNNLSLIGRRERVELWNGYIKSFVKILMSKIEIMQSGKTQSEINKINTISNDIIVVNRKMALSVHLCYRTAEAFVVWVKFGILFYVGLGIFEGVYTLAFFVGLFGVMSLMDSTIVQSMKFFRNFTKNFTTIEKLWDFFDTTPQIEGYDSGKIFQHKHGEIILQNINYSYDESKPVFQDFSLDIPGSKVTAFVGPSGGGKSTLVKLIAGYIRANSGDIEVDSQSLKEVSLKSYYKDVGYLTQEPSVFDGTIRENLLYAVGEDTDEKQIEKIIKLAHCDFIYDLSDGIDTEIGERGVKLSGGQKQRLAIAKIFLKDPKIIILDEPTSALDSVSEQKITQAMHNLFKNRTVLVIAHRLQTVKHADDIIVIEGGKMIERGTHNELVKQKGFYKQMLDLQSGF